MKFKADSLGSARFSVGVSGRTVILNVVWTRANTAMGFGKARKMHGQQFLVYLVPANGQIIGSAAKLLVVRKPRHTFKFSDGPTSDLLVLYEFEGSSHIGCYNG